MRKTLRSALLAVLVLLATGCAAGPPAPAGPPDAGDAAFPVTVRHAFGEVTVPRRPQRVVTLGAGDLAVANALGAPVVGSVPAGLEPGEPNLPYQATPLPAEVFGIAQSPTDGSVDVEQVAALRPDLVLAVTSSAIAPETYAVLSRVAPVVTYERSLFGSTMQEDALLIGRALGAGAQAQRLVDAADAAVRDFAAAHPQLAQRTYLYGQARGEVLPLVVGEDNLSTRFMRSLGPTVPPSFAAAPASDALAPGTVGISYEEAGRLDEADVLFMTFATPADRGVFESNEVVRRLRVVAEGRYHPIDLDVAVALQAPNVVAVPWLLEQLRPGLVGAAR